MKNTKKRVLVITVSLLVWMMTLVAMPSVVHAETETSGNCQIEAFVGLQRGESCLLPNGAGRRAVTLDNLQALPGVITMSRVGTDANGNCTGNAVGATRVFNIGPRSDENFTCSPDTGTFKIANTGGTRDAATIDVYVGAPFKG